MTKTLDTEHTHLWVAEIPHPIPYNHRALVFSKTDLDLVTSIVGLDKPALIELRPDGGIAVVGGDVTMVTFKVGEKGKGFDHKSLCWNTTKNKWLDEDPEMEGFSSFVGCHLGVSDVSATLSENINLYLGADVLIPNAMLRVRSVKRDELEVALHDTFNYFYSYLDRSEFEYAYEKPTDLDEIDVICFTRYEQDTKVCELCFVYDDDVSLTKVLKDTFENHHDGIITIDKTDLDEKDYVGSLYTLFKDKEALFVVVTDGELQHLYFNPCYIMGDTMDNMDRGPNLC